MSIRDGMPGALDTLPSSLTECLDGQAAAAYTLVPKEARGVGLDQVHTHGLPAPALRHALASVMQTVKVGWTGFDPLRPEPAQRNVVVGWAELARLGVQQNATFTQIYPKFGINTLDQLRVVVCDGPHLLAWIGIVRPHRFAERERRMLRAIVPALRRRLQLEGMTGVGPLGLDALTTTLDAIPAVAVIADHAGNVALANALAVATWEHDAASFLENIRRCVAQRPPVAGWTVRSIASRGVPGLFLLVGPSAPGEPGPALLRARQAWHLTPRQVDVLRGIVAGKANKAIASDLGCAEATVEVHVTALLARAGCSSRAELIATFWRQHR